MAGNNPIQVNRTDDTLRNPIPTIAIRGCDGTFSNVTTPSNLAALTCANDSTSPHSLAIVYEADKYNTRPTTAGKPTDCLGNSLTALTATLPPVSYYVADNRFYIATSNAVPSLYCIGNGGTTQPMVENIEDLQIKYGTINPTALTNSDATVAGYLTATEVSASSVTNAIQMATNWSKVLTVRVCVVVQSEPMPLSDIVTTSYNKCDGSLDATRTDRRLRRAYATTITLRNRRL